MHDQVARAGIAYGAPVRPLPEFDRAAKKQGVLRGLGNSARSGCGELCAGCSAAGHGAFHRAAPLIDRHLIFGSGGGEVVEHGGVGRFHGVPWKCPGLGCEWSWPPAGRREAVRGSIRRLAVHTSDCRRGFGQRERSAGSLDPVGVVTCANVTRGMWRVSMVGELSAYPHVAGSFSGFWLFGARNVVRHCGGRPPLMVAVSCFGTWWFRRD